MVAIQPGSGVTGALVEAGEDGDSDGGGLGVVVICGGAADDDDHCQTTTPTTAIRATDRRTTVATKPVRLLAGFIFAGGAATT